MAGCSHTRLEEKPVAQTGAVAWHRCLLCGILVKLKRGILVDDE